MRPKSARLGRQQLAWLLARIFHGVDARRNMYRALAEGGDKIVDELRRREDGAVWAAEWHGGVQQGLFYCSVNVRP